LLRRMFYWTGGHPYLTQRLCQAVADRMKAGTHEVGDGGRRKEAGLLPSPTSWVPALILPPSAVDSPFAPPFPARGAREKDDNLIVVRERLLRSELPARSREETVSGLLERYGQVRAGRRVPDDDTDPLCELLKLAGIVRIAHPPHPSLLSPLSA